MTLKAIPSPREKREPRIRMLPSVGRPAAEPVVPLVKDVLRRRLEREEQRGNVSTLKQRP